MRTPSHRRRRQRGVILVLYTLMLPTVILPLVGLATDLNILYIVQAKLSAAVDGAALGAGRLLGTGANIEEIAGEFITVNFPEGYWAARNLQTNIKYKVENSLHTVTIEARADVPLLFMRIFGWESVSVAAAGQAARREVRVILVLDRSGSLVNDDPTHTVFPTLKAAAESFTRMFTPGLDELGLVVFENSGIVLYPPLGTPWNPSPVGAGGPDVNFLSNHTAGGTNQPGGDMVTHIQNLAALGGTSMAEGLSLGWVEMQKAWNRDGLGVNDFKVNALVLFTDGIPTALTAFVNKSAGWALKNYCSGAGCDKPTTSPCTHNPSDTADDRMIGRIQLLSYPKQWGNTPASALYQLATLQTQTATWWDTRPDWDSPLSGTPISNCYQAYTPGNPPGGLRYTGGYDGAGYLADLKRVPPEDYYGNSTGGTAYQGSARVYDGTNYDPTNLNNPYHVGIACWNTVDNGATRIRTDPNIKISIYAIGYYGGNPLGRPDDYLLTRVTNYGGAVDPSQPQGKYYPVGTPDAIAQAFADLGSILLRLAH